MEWYFYKIASPTGVMLVIPSHSNSLITISLGILTSPQKKLGKDGKGIETISVSNVRMMQATGAQVIPISYSLPDEELKTMVKSVNGLLIPGTSKKQVGDIAYLKFKKQ